MRSSRLARVASFASRFDDSPVAVVGIASVKSGGAASRISGVAGVSYPNAVDLGGATYALYNVASGSVYGFLIDPDGKVVVGWGLSTYRSGSSPRQYSFDLDAEEHLKKATDPFGIGEVPPACRKAYSALKVGQFELARALAKGLARVRNDKIKDAAGKIVAAADETEEKKLALMAKLASEGRAGELEEEMKAFLLAFPTGRSRTKLSGFASKAKATQDGKRELLAAKNFQQALGLLKKNNDRLNTQARAMCRAIATQFKGTYHANLAEALMANWPTGR